MGQKNAPKNASRRWAHRAQTLPPEMVSGTDVRPAGARTIPISASRPNMGLRSCPEQSCIDLALEVAGRLDFRAELRDRPKMGVSWEARFARPDVPVSPGCVVRVKCCGAVGGTPPTRADVKKVSRDF